MVLTKLRYVLNMVDFGHTLFGLPFAYLGAFLAIKGMPTVYQLIWITLAMVGARTAALCLNRLIDLDIDRANPRTADWVLPSERLSPKKVWILVFLSLTLLLFSARQLNPLCLKLSPLAVIVLWVYSYTKRFTWWCHLILGLAIGIGPVGAWIAITGTFDWQPFILGMAVACWIAGFDTMYAC
ncbi:MAG TPA: 4-hydroxybenzoate octaprenyltransferase, partial [Syntrophomonas sp.]|nr:4-hydroxybenzoate octaprenyltransferase [Syntrophomonas sp.]